MSNSEMMAIIKKMETDIKDLTIALEKSNTATEKMFSILNAKLDIFKNLSADAANEVAPSISGAQKKLNRPVHFKMLFLEKREEYMNILWRDTYQKFLVKRLTHFIIRPIIKTFCNLQILFFF